MGDNPLRELVNRLLWDEGIDGRDVSLLVTSRSNGAAGIETVAFERVAEVLAAGVVLVEGTFLPYHRIVAVRRADEELWPAHQGEER